MRFQDELKEHYKIGANWISADAGLSEAGITPADIGAKGVVLEGIDVQIKQLEIMAESVKCYEDSDIERWLNAED